MPMRRQLARKTEIPVQEVVTPKKTGAPLDLLALPVLKETDKVRYGLDEIRINMVRPANKTRPYASAIINLQTVQVGEKIPDSRATLIGVEQRAIGVEIEGSGERYQVRF